MSIKALNWAWDQTCDTLAEKLVLLGLADHANDDGACWPAQDTLAGKCGLSREGVNRALKSLEQNGQISSQRRLDRFGRDIGKKYSLRMVGVTGNHTSVTRNHTGVTGNHTSVTGNHMPCDEKSHANNVVEPSLNHQEREQLALGEEESRDLQDDPVTTQEPSGDGIPWDRFREIMPLRSGKFIGEQECRKTWDDHPELQAAWIASARNYAVSAEVRDGKICKPSNFLSRIWKDWTEPESTSGSAPPTPQPDLTWMINLQEDERIARQEAAGGMRKERPKPPWLTRN